MNQEQIGKLIKELRIKHGLTQTQFADKYNVTFQAVSKWENGKNLPDTALLVQICKDFNIDFEELLKGVIKEEKKTNVKFIKIIITTLIVLFIALIIYFCTNDSFTLKTLSSNCLDFNVNGVIVYDNNKSSIYISEIEYCGGIDNEIYKSIDCELYEINNNLERRVSSCNYSKNENINLQTYLKSVTINLNNYQGICKNYTTNSLYLLINAKNKDNKTITYKIPLTIDECI